MKMEQQNNSMSPMNARSPHFWWIISTLLAIIIILLVIIIRGQIVYADKVIGEISTIALLLSIILSILAIAFTYTSNNNVAQQFDKINTAANNINDSSVKVAGLIDSISDRLDKLEKKQESMIEKMDNRNAQVPQGMEIRGNVASPTVPPSSDKAS